MLSLSIVRRMTATCGVLAASFMVLPASATHVRRAPVATRSHHRIQGKGALASGTHSASSGRPRAMDDARATEIQSALVKAGYLQSSSGHWDDASADAMRKLQADNGWQTKLIPDSRALIKLGLGANAGGTTTGAVSAATPAE